MLYRWNDRAFEVVMMFRRVVVYSEDNGESKYNIKIEMTQNDRGMTREMTEG